MDCLYAQLQATMEATDSNIDKGVEMVELDEGFGDGIEEISISDVAETLSVASHTLVMQIEISVYGVYVRHWACHTEICILAYAHAHL